MKPATVTGGRKLRKRLREIQRLPREISAEVGFLKNSAVNRTAAENEFGVPEREVPERPVWRATTPAAIEIVKRESVRMAKKTRGAPSVEGVIDIMHQVRDEYARAYDHPASSLAPNQPSRVSRKGHDDLLVGENGIPKLSRHITIESKT